ncbi:transporter substrate-binding domain-containing protein [Marinobacter halodurans]|uniref:Transporter substrate-binding domain-containing protein n=1 Tax=Marinobacter halodurans TaxID=2528979 RepID=A0ABY1ZHZ1_9GAMM|nr:transporter substrate-binding domain-containing protein [Marinobacter halodurans]TBW50549.1 transporter substrate-binding domain-containing protein [Marinobacter halodurans]
MPTSTGTGCAGIVTGQARFGLALLLMCLLAAPAARADNTLFRIFTENYPPYNVSETGKNFAHKREDIGGICTEMVEALMANTPYKYEMKMRDWSFAYRWVQEHKNHALFCTARTDDREDQFQWVGPLASIRWTLFAAPDSNIKLKSLEDAKDMKIAGYKGDVMTDYLLKKGFNVTASVTDEQNPRRLVLGQVDLWVTDGLVGPLVAKENGDIAGLRPVLVFRETPMYLAVSNQTDPALVAKLQAGLDKAREDGTIDAIKERYGIGD